jgi:hypothetical protein
MDAATTEMSVVTVTHGRSRYSVRAGLAGWLLPAAAEPRYRLMDNEKCRHARWATVLPCNPRPG